MIEVLDAREKARGRYGSRRWTDERSEESIIAFMFIFILTLIYFLLQSAASQCDLQGETETETDLFLKLLTKPLKLSRRFSTQGARSVTFEGSRALE